MSRPLISLIATVSSLLPLRLFTYLQNSVQPLPSFLHRDLKNDSCTFFLANSNCFESHLSSYRYWHHNILLFYLFWLLYLMFQFHLVLFRVGILCRYYMRNKFFYSLTANAHTFSNNLKFRMMDEVHRPSDSVLCAIASSLWILPGLLMYTCLHFGDL
jgi:hypothetical protein